MGNSLQDALQTALNKSGAKAAKGKLSSGKKRKVRQDKDHSSIRGKKEIDLALSGQQIEGEQSFSELMEKGGFKALKENKKKVRRQAPSIAGTKKKTAKRTSYRPDISRKTRRTKDQPKKITPPKKESLKVRKKLKGKEAAHSNSAKTVKLLKKKVPVTNNVPAKPPVTDPDYRIRVTKPITPNPLLTELLQSKKQVALCDGAIEQISGQNSDDEREVNIGLDFGTSSVKVVIGDNVLNKAFAVPFYDAIGLDSFLLPSRVWKNDDGYSLKKSGVPYRNLKLQLTNKKCKISNFVNAAAFLAFVIRHARGWLLTSHQDIYRRTKIAWKLTLGLPAENYNNDKLVTRFKKLAAASWLLSQEKTERLPEKVVIETCTRVWGDSFDNIHTQPKLMTIDFDVVPELSAQIYGFLTSTKFDPKARNIFMIVDVGAGTIDSSIFHVKRERAKRLSFDFYANFVEFNGVANLHAYRMQWYRSIMKMKQLGDEFEATMQQMGTPSDFTGAIPENISEYFEGVKVSFSSQKRSPDYSFMVNRVKAQVLGKTLKKARDGVESHRAFAGMPVFVCGGGSRMYFYKKLEEHLLSHPNASWFRFKPRRLEVPDILNVPGVTKDDFDRLSVAFGLSFVQVARCVKRTTPPPPPVTPPRNPPCPGCGSRTICYCG